MKRPIILISTENKLPEQIKQEANAALKKYHQAEQKVQAVKENPQNSKK